VRRITGRRVEIFYRFYYFSPLFYRSWILAVARALRSDAPDAILLHNFSHFAPIVRRLNPTARIVLAMHCDWLVELEPKVVERRLRSVDAVTGCSGYIAQGVARRFPPFAARCHPLHNGSDTRRFARASEEDPGVRELRQSLDLGDGPVLLFTGRVCPEKGVHVLLEAMKRVRAAEPGATLLVAGPIANQPPSPLSFSKPDAWLRELEALRPDYRERLRSAAEAHGDRVRLLGPVPNDQLAPYYAIADVFVHPAIWNEPFGMTLTEAMACGCPVVSTRAGGIPEIVREGETGLLADPGDPDTLADALLELLRDPDRAKEMGARGFDRVHSTFTWEHTARTLEAVFERLPERRGDGG
jgi:glycosyltransferase involved in cell wall biosynthesis